MLTLEVGRSSGAGGSGSMLRREESQHERLRAMSSGLTLGLDAAATASSWKRREEIEMAAAQFHHHLHQQQQQQQQQRSFPVQLDLLPRAPAVATAAVVVSGNHQTGSPPQVSCLSRQSLFGAGNNDCEEIAAPETHSSSRGASAGRGGIDMNEIPADVETSSPRSCSISPGGSGGGAFAFDIARKGESSSVNIKRERDVRQSGGSGGGAGGDENGGNANNCEVSSRGSDEEDGAPRKKLRLSKEQSALLEKSFKEHSTLNPKQKNALAKHLNLRPRQVEVWFQNRRARTKLKQTEIDCELLKRCCETLTEENRRLQKELQELRAIKVPPPCVISQDFFMPLPAATLTMCPSCERLAAVDSRSGHIPPPPFSSKHHQQQQQHPHHLHHPHPQHPHAQQHQQHQHQQGGAATNAGHHQQQQQQAFAVHFPRAVPAPAACQS